MSDLGLTGTRPLDDAVEFTPRSESSSVDPISAGIDETDRARAQEYSFLATFLTQAPNAVLLQRVADLRADPTPLGLLHAQLAEAAAAIKPEDVELEFFDLFIGVGRGELLPYASYYMAGFLHERPLARLREDLNALGIERAPGIHEPEDHIGIIFEIMAGLASGHLPAPQGTDRRIFEKHLKPWAGRFFTDLENAKSARFYRGIGKLGRTLMEIEAEAFALSN